MVSRIYLRITIAESRHIGRSNLDPHSVQTFEAELDILIIICLNEKASRHCSIAIMALFSLYLLG